VRRRSLSLSSASRLAALARLEAGAALQASSVSLTLRSRSSLRSTRVLQPYYESTEPDFLHYRNVAKQILQKEDELAEIVQLVGKSSLGEGDKVTLDVARLIKEDFLQQNGISVYDRYCPFYKTVRRSSSSPRARAAGGELTLSPIPSPPLSLPPSPRIPSRTPLANLLVHPSQTAMLKNLVTYFEAAVKAVEGGELTWNRVRESTSDLWYRLTQMKFEDPATGEGASLLFPLSLPSLRGRPRLSVEK